MYIDEGYRPVGTTLKGALISAFETHNEFINFWTHFVPGLEMLRQIYIFDGNASDPRSLSFIIYMVCTVTFY